MKNYNNEQEMLSELAEFINAEQVAPRPEVSESILAKVEKDLHPETWKIFGKLTLVEVAAGLATLTICPQFGLGFGGHNPFLHELHAAMPSTAFYLLCGVFFVTLGALIGGLVLNRYELGAIKRSVYTYFAGYSALAYLALVILGPDAFVIGSLAWVAGAMLGNLFGYSVAVHIRQTRISL